MKSTVRASCGLFTARSEISAAMVWAFMKMTDPVTGQPFVPICDPAALMRLATARYRSCASAYSGVVMSPATGHRHEERGEGEDDGGQA